ncbi:MAG: MATE family efflux transporter [Thermoproteota archaeon]
MGAAIGLKGLADVLKESAPLILAEGTSSIAWLVDTLFVSMLGDEAVAAVGVGGYGSWLASVAMMLFYVGVIVVVSQALGGSRTEYAERVVAQSLTAAAATGLLIAATVQVAAPYIAAAVAGTRGEVAELAAGYLRARSLGLPLLGAWLTLDAAYRAAKRNNPIMYSALAAALTNVVLDPLLIFTLGYGVVGAGLATAVSYLPAVALLAVRSPIELGFAARPALPGRLALHVATVGAPSIAERVMMTLAHGFFLGSVARCGESSLAAHTIGVRIESIAFLPAFALSTYASSVVGQLVGAGDIDGAEREGWRVAKASAALMSLGGGLLVVLSPLAPRAFGVSSAVAEQATVYLVLAGISEPFLGLVMALAGAIRGAGNTLAPSALNIVGVYAFRAAPAVVAASRLRGGGPDCATTIWAIMALDLAARALVFSMVYRRYFRRLVRLVA